MRPEFKGRGGTAMEPAIARAKELDPDAIIYFTDGDIFDNPQDPEIPFLWAIVGEQKKPTDFGEEIRIQETY
ncbi:MAG: hypothetical protein BWY21_02208 [Parcubacteria group bacterium ADurb.Bin216]|nr:MAG: hypothetical protein BWY21_02208 [Parcubacteria group bacterium ADurb.Bin216]